MLGNVLAVGFQTNPLLVVMMIVVVGLGYMHFYAVRRIAKVEQRLTKAERSKRRGSSPAKRDQKKAKR